MEKLENRNTSILICIDIIKINVNIRNIAFAIQWKILNHLVFAILFEQIGRAKYDKTLFKVSIIFIKCKHVLSNNIALIRKTLFHDYRTTIEPHNRA